MIFKTEEVVQSIPISHRECQGFESLRAHRDEKRLSEMKAFFRCQ